VVEKSEQFGSKAVFPWGAIFEAAIPALMWSVVKNDVGELVGGGGWSGGKRLSVKIPAQYSRVVSNT